MIWKLAQFLANLWLQKKTLSQWKEISSKSAVTYVEGVRAFRYASMILASLIFLIIILAAGIGLMIHGALTLQALSPEGLAWLEVSIGGILLLATIIGVTAAMSESLWIRIFKIDQLISKVQPGHQPDLSDLRAEKLETVRTHSR